MPFHKDITRHTGKPTIIPHKFKKYHIYCTTVKNTYQNEPKWVYTPLGEPLDVIFDRMVKNNLVIFPHKKEMDEDPPKPPWFKDNEYCTYHQVKGHTTLDYIQDLVNCKELTVGWNTKNSQNENYKSTKILFHPTTIIGERNLSTPPPTKNPIKTTMACTRKVTFKITRITPHVTSTMTILSTIYP